VGQLDGQVAIVTGAGSGVGRAAALALAGEGAVVALAGRREEPLRETATLVTSLPDVDANRALVTPCDVTVPEQVRDMVARVLARFGRIDVLVNNAGLNVPRRALAEMEPADWRRIVTVNLEGPYLCVHAVLPTMREQGSGTFIHIGSKAAWRPSPLAGAAYTAAKAGLAGLSAAINAEERVNGLRSAVIILGDVNTPLLDNRPTPPSAETRAQLLDPDDVAACVRLIASLPPRARIEELVLLSSYVG